MRDIYFIKNQLHLTVQFHIPYNLRLYCSIFILSIISFRYHGTKPVLECEWQQDMPYTISPFQTCHYTSLKNVEWEHKTSFIASSTMNKKLSEHLVNDI